VTPPSLQRRNVELLEQSPPYARALLEQLGLRGLHCGCGGAISPGWLNTDVLRIEGREGGASEPGRLALVDGDRYYLEHDALERLPFEDASFDWAYSEHMIEHFEPGPVAAWLAEVRRVLRPGGHIRLSTPDLRKYVSGYQDADGGFYAEHRERIADTLSRFLDPRNERQREVAALYFPGEIEIPARRGWMLNQIFQLWGHKWVFDVAEIRHVAVVAGFPGEKLVECEFGNGRVAEVAEMDRAPRSDESLYVELERD
jgi:SAM-dependent methyltransferase